MLSEIKRYAIVTGSPNRVSAKVVQDYLPANYQVIWQRTVTRFGHEEVDVVIEGRDYHGWTLDAYVIPRLGSGLIGCKEIDLTHEVMKEIPVLGMGQCTDDPGDGRIYLCQSRDCPVHGARNRSLSSKD